MQPPATIRVTLPFHLRTLARIDGELQLEIPAPVTQRAILDAVEKRYPMLCGTIREHDTLTANEKRRHRISATAWL